MFGIQPVFYILVLIVTASCYSVIDNGLRFEASDEIVSNEIIRNRKSVFDGDCSSLSPELITEIKSHQPIVDKITAAIVNGKYSKDTWNS